MRLNAQGRNVCMACVQLRAEQKRRGPRNASSHKKLHAPTKAQFEPWRAAYEDGRAVRARFDAMRKADADIRLARFRAEMASLRQREAAA